MTVTLAAAMFAAVLSAGAAGPDVSAGSAPNAGAPAQNEALTRAQVNAYLGASDTTAENWRELGPTAVPFLARVIDDRDASPPRRARAVYALSIIGSHGDARHLLELARTEAEPNVVRIAALRSAVKLLPKADAVTELKPLLKGARATRVRVVAAESMTRLNKRNGCVAVRAQVGKEKPRDQKYFQRALRRCPPAHEGPKAPSPSAPAAAAEPAGEAK